jgi:two-component system, OmpR family, sensor kinase
VIRHRLLAAIMAAVTAVMTLTGVVVIRVLEYRLVAVIDQQLTAFASQQPPVSGSREHRVNGATGPASGGTHMTIVEVGPKGELRTQIPAGPASDPGALPDLAGLTAPFAPRTLPPAGGDGPGYRAVAIALPDGGMVVAAIPLGDVEAAVAETRRILLAAGVAALAVVAAIVWLSIRRGLRPIDDMINAAERIAGGDLTARTSTPRSATEVGQLSSALNTMLDRIQQAMTTRAESEARMRRFVADASHELRTPLTSIRGYAELHRQGATSAEEVARGMARIEREAEHMAALVEDLLLLARLDQARPLADEPVDLTRVVEEAVADARAADPQRSIVADLPDHPAVVRGDRPRLRQVLDNLLANVRDHTDPGTAATITLAGNNGAATLTVADDGPGMRPEEAARAFERFWQAEPTPTHPRPGAGLGLAIVAELIAAHRGTVTLDTTPGAGTSFTITLPAADDRIVRGRSSPWRGWTGR